MTNRLLSTRWAAFSAKDNDYDEEDRVDYLPRHSESFFVSAEEARGQVEDCIECGKVTAQFRGSAGPDHNKYCLV